MQSLVRLLLSQAITISLVYRSRITPIQYDICFPNISTSCLLVNMVRSIQHPYVFTVPGLLDSHKASEETNAGMTS